MKKTALILFACIAFSFIGNAQTETRTKGWSIETDKFNHYGADKIHYRRDKLNRMVLQFTKKEDRIDIFLVMYDTYGNIMNHPFTLIKDKENPIKYNCDCSYTAAEFNEVKEKLLDALDNK